MDSSGAKSSRQALQLINGAWCGGIDLRLRRILDNPFFMLNKLLRVLALSMLGV